MERINAGQFRVVCMAALFTMGSTVISAPYRGSDSYTLIGFAAAFAAALFCFAGLIPAVNCIYNGGNNGGAYQKIIFGIIYFFTAALLLTDAVFSFNVFCDFVSRNIIEKTPKPIIALIFAAVIYFAAINRDGTMLKFSLFSAVISAAVITVFFFFRGQIFGDALSCLHVFWAFAENRDVPSDKRVCLITKETAVQQAAAQRSLLLF